MINSFKLLTGFALFFLFSSTAHALIHALPANLAHEVLSETVPTAFAPTKFEVSDFDIEWLGRPLSQVKAVLGEKSIEWVRASELLVLPRGRLLIHASKIQGGNAWNAGFYQAFQVAEGDGTIELPVALISGEQNRVDLTIKRDGKEEKGSLVIRFKPKLPHPGPRVFTDTTCSPYGVSVQTGSALSDQWIFVGCRLVYVEGKQHPTASLEAFVFWDNVGQKISIGDVESSSSSTSVWPLRVKSRPGFVTLKSKTDEVKISYAIPERTRLGNLSVGIGPYAHVFESTGEKISTIAPLVTLYGSYFITETMRLVAFNATAVTRLVNTDFGVYLNSESVRAIDRRLSLNVMLGGHVLGFKSNNQHKLKFGAPQGVEVVYRDALMKGYNFSVGSFVYPPIQGTSYYNMWVRWGRGSFFGELNYIGWSENLDDGRVYTRSVGLTFGFPLFRFL